MSWVARCAICAAPLTGTAAASVVSCAYCGSENWPGTSGAGVRAERLSRAAAEASAMQPDIDARVAELSAALTAAVERGDFRAALRHQEGVLRLSYAPTIHMYRHAPDDPQTVAALEEIDRAIDAALQQTAASWNVPYTPANQRTPEE